MGEKMKIFVENQVVDFESFDKTFEQFNASPEAKLVYWGNAITDVSELEEGKSYQIVECLDGGKKKKKKKYNTPKRIPGKKKKLSFMYYNTIKLIQEDLSQEPRKCVPPVCVVQTYS